MKQETILESTAVASVIAHNLFDEVLEYVNRIEREGVIATHFKIGKLAQQFALKFEDVTEGWEETVLTNPAKYGLNPEKVTDWEDCILDFVKQELELY